MFYDVCAPDTMLRCALGKLREGWVKENGVCCCNFKFFLAMGVLSAFYYNNVYTQLTNFVIKLFLFLLSSFQAEAICPYFLFLIYFGFSLRIFISALSIFLKSWLKNLKTWVGNPKKYLKIYLKIKLNKKKICFECELSSMTKMAFKTKL